MSRKYRGAPREAQVVKKTPRTKESIAPMPAVKIDPYEGLSEAAKAVALAFDALSEEDAKAVIAACLVTKTT